MKTLYYKESRGTLVFAPPDIAERVSQIHFALSAPTWGELKARMPEGELEAIRSEDEDPDDLQEPDDASEDPAERISGFSEGDYPIWLQTLQHTYLPADICDQYGVSKSSVHNGNFWSFDPANAGVIVNALQLKGYEVIRRDDLTFW